MKNRKEKPDSAPQTDYLMVQGLDRVIYWDGTMAILPNQGQSQPMLNSHVTNVLVVSHPKSGRQLKVEDIIHRRGRVR